MSQMTMAHAGGDQHKGMTLQRKFQEKVNLLEVSVSEILLALVTSFIFLPFQLIKTVFATFSLEVTGVSDSIECTKIM